jgi:hypothetical protein
MQSLAPLESIDYLVIGHLTIDLTPAGPVLGGTAAYAALTAQALGCSVGIVTSWGAELPLGPLRAIPVVSYPSDRSTTFENRQTPQGRVQVIHHVAPQLDYYQVPEPWRKAPIVHLGPVANEVEPSLVRRFPSALIGLTPQGWLRAWDGDGRVSPAEWPESSFTLLQAGAAVISVEDVGGDEERIEELASQSRVLVVTEAEQGARVYWHGDVRRIRAPQVEQVDPTGSGDIFAAAFFTRLYQTRDPWESARFANQLAALSVTRPGLSGVPSLQEVQDTTIEVL